MVRTSIVLSALFLQMITLAGCMTPEQETAYAQREMDHMIVIYGPACEKLGYQANTDPWRNCVMQLGYKNDLQRNGSFSGPYWTHW